MEAEGGLHDRSVARSTAFAIGQRYFHGTLGQPDILCAEWRSCE